LTPRLRNYALAALLSRSNRALPVLAGLQSGALGAADLSPTQADYLRTLRDAAAGERARLLLGPVPVRRPEAVQRYRPALSLQGSAGRGREIYLARCAGCHQPTGETPALGSNLADARVYGREEVLIAILEPNAGVRSHHRTQVVETVDGECLVGILRAQNPTTITLQEVSGAQVVLLRSSIQRMQEQQWSLMPEGLEAGLTPQFMADLLEYVMSAAR
jgi:putative heme-binding domain-containing protein